MRKPQRRNFGEQQPRQAAKRHRSSFWQGPWPIVGTLGGIILLIMAFVLVSRLSSPGHGAAATSSPTADPAVVAALSHVSPSVVDAVGTGGAANPLHQASGSPLTAGTKAEVLYVGAEWCPYCAAERWAMVVALSHFGSFSGLHVTTSSSSDVFPDTRTLSFNGSSYSSQYVQFVPVETQDRNRNALQSPTDAQQQILQTLDPDSSIPFLDLGNRYTMVGQGVPPDPLQGLSWQQIASALSNPSSAVTRAIVGNANYLTAGICKLPSTASASICSDTTIKQMAAQLPG